MQDFTGLMTNEETFYNVEYENTKYAGLDFSSAKGTKNYCKLVFQTSGDATQYYRTIYTALDYLGDVGGLIDALKYIAYVFLWVFQADGLIHFIMSRMFKYRDIFRTDGEK